MKKILMKTLIATVMFTAIIGSVYSSNIRQIVTTASGYCIGNFIALKFIIPAIEKWQNK